MEHIGTVNELLAYLSEGNAVEYIFFWKHKEKNGEAISQCCLSNWYQAKFTVDGVTYATSEHYMMANKAIVFCDTAIYHKILAAKTPKEAKALGKSIRGFNGVIWNEHRIKIVVRGNEAKFSQNEPLKDYLLKTGDKVLVEASPYDCIWGIGMGADDHYAMNPKKWNGLNLLGFALMEVRRRLRANEKQNR